MAKHHRGHGEGSIFRRKDKRWVAELFDGYDEEGKKRPPRRWYGKTRKEVADLLTAALREKQQGLLPKASKETLGRFLDAWMEDVVRNNVRPTTYKTYQHILKHSQPIRDVQMVKLTPQHLQRLYAGVLDAGLGRTAQVLHAVLHKALDQAMKWGLVPRNVAEAVESPKVDEREFRVLSSTEVSRLLAAASEDRLYALYVLAITSGLRFGELLGLRWDDLDLDSCRLMVRHQLQLNEDGKPVLGPPKTKKSVATIKLTETAVKALRQHRKRQLEERLKIADVWQDQGLVFCTEIGTPLSESNVRRRSFHKILDRAGLPRIRFHDLRHTCATLLLARGVHPKLVQELLRHARIGTTMDLYSHATPEMMDQVAEEMDKVVASAASRG